MAATATTVKPYVSPSQLDMFCKCGEQYRRRYIEKEIIPPGIALLQGGAFAKATEGNMRQKIESHADVPAADIEEMASAAFDTALAGGYALTKDEESRGAATVLGEAKDQTVEMAGFHIAKQAPDYQPVLVEERVRIELPNSTHDLLGIMDLADDKDRVTDFKTSGKRKNQNDVDSSVQLTTYAAAFKAKTGREASEVRLDTVVQLKSGMVRDVQKSDRKEADYKALANRISLVTVAIQKGVFTPASPMSWWCAAKWCGYHSTCPFVNSERKAAAEATA